MQDNNKTNEQLINELNELRQKVSEYEKSETLHKQTEQALKFKINMDNVIIWIATRFINLEYNEVDKNITHVLKIIGEFIEVDRSSVFLFSEDNIIMHKTHYWKAEELEPEIDGINELSIDQYQWWKEKLDVLEDIYIPSVAELPVEANKEKELLQLSNAKSCLIIPMNYNNNLAGFLRVDSIQNHRKWTQDEVTSLKMMSEIFVTTLKHKEAEKSITELVEKRTFKLTKATDLLQWEMTEHRKTEAALYQTEESFRNIIHSSPMGIHIFEMDDEDNLILQGANPAADAILGLNHTQYINKTIEDIYPNLSSTDVYDKYRHIALEGDIGYSDHIIYKNQEISDAYEVHSFRSKPRTLVNMFCDITKRKKSELAILGQNELIMNIFESLTHPFYVIDAEDHTIIMANSTARKRAIETTTCYALSRRDTPCEGKDNPCPLKYVKLHKKPTKVKHCYVDEDGNSHFFEIYGYPIFDAEGNVKQMIEYSLDVTDRLYAEMALRESEEKYSYLFHHSSDGIFLHDNEGKIIDVNNRIFDLLGYTRDEILDMNIFSLPYHHALDIYKNALKNISKKVFVKFEIDFKKKSGELIMTEVLLNIIEIIGKQYYQATVRNITQRKMAEQALLKAKETAEEANRLKSQFLTNIGHEIRTPLNGIIGMTEVTLYSVLTDEQKENLEIVRESALSLLSLLNDVLDLSFIEKGELALNTINFSLRETIDNTINSFLQRAQVRCLKLTYNVSPDIPDSLVGDSIRLRQVLTNLINNGLKFTEKDGEVIVTIELVETSYIHYVCHNRIGENDLCLHVAVSDTGIGIPDEKQKMIFDSFTQVDGSVSRKYDGTGLGLSISKQLVEMMGGEIWVESNLDKGSIFHFTASFEQQDK